MSRELSSRSWVDLPKSWTDAKNSGACWRAESPQRRPGFSRSVLRQPRRAIPARDAVVVHAACGGDGACRGQHCGVMANELASRHHHIFSAATRLPNQEERFDIASIYAAILIHIPITATSLPDQEK